MYGAGKLARSHVQMAACADKVVGDQIPLFYDGEGNRVVFQQEIPLIKFEIVPEKRMYSTGTR